MLECVASLAKLIFSEVVLNACLAIMLVTVVVKASTVRILFDMDVIDPLMEALQARPPVVGICKCTAMDALVVLTRTIDAVHVWSMLSKSLGSVFLDSNYCLSLLVWNAGRCVGTSKV